MCLGVVYLRNMSRVQVLPYHIVSLQNLGVDPAPPPRPAKPPELRRGPQTNQASIVRPILLAPSKPPTGSEAPPLPSKPPELQGTPLSSKYQKALKPVPQVKPSVLVKPPPPPPTSSKPRPSSQAPILLGEAASWVAERTQKGDNRVQSLHPTSLQTEGTAIHKPALISVSCGKRERVEKGVTFSIEAVLQQVIVDGDNEQFKQLLEEHGRSVVRRSDPAGKPLALRAVEYGKYEILEMLVSNGALLTSCDDDGWTPLHAASVRDDVRAAKLIVRSGQVGITTSRCLKHLRPIDIAKSEEMASVLLLADLELFRKEQADLLKRGAIGQGFTTCCEEEGSLVGKLLVQDDKDAYKMAWGITDKWQGGLLHLAARKNYPKAAVLTLERRLVSIDSVNSKGETPLHCAAKRRATDMILLFKQFGADMSIRDNKGNTASYYASPLHCTWLISEC